MYIDCCEMWMVPAKFTNVLYMYYIAKI